VKDLIRKKYIYDNSIKKEVKMCREEGDEKWQAM
jgi:hypothetical protein